MRKIFVAFDDTDNLDGAYGTGKVARWFLEDLPEGLTAWGVVRQQLLVHDDIPFTSHNSSACIVLMDEGGYPEGDLVDRAVAHIERHALPGSDPGLCIAEEDSPAMGRLKAFGRAAAERVLTQAEAIEAARGVHLSGHGGTNGGIIGSAAAVGLTAAGWFGRFIEYRSLRKLPETCTVEELNTAGIRVLSIDRDARIPCPRHTVKSCGWLRPHLVGHVPTLLVRPLENDSWEPLAGKRNSRENSNVQTL
jgi:tRNA(Ile2) C34 agmatinyltransferase TiaS